MNLVGHNLGMQHDNITDSNSFLTTICYDLNIYYIMDPIALTISRTFSTCSKLWIK
jgi:hypothetical protein